MYLPQRDAAEPHALEWRNLELLAVYRRVRDLCWEVLAGGQQIDLSRLLAAARFRPEAGAEDLANVPPSGAVLAVADCPSNVMESLAAAALFRGLRPDAKTLTSRAIARVPNLGAHFIGYDRWHTRRAAPANVRAMAQALRHLRTGGLLVVFPADGRPRRLGHPAAETGWVAAVRAARLTGACVVPVSLTRSHAETAVFPTTDGNSIEMRTGAALDPARLAGFSNDTEAGSYLRWRTTLLARRHEPPVRLVPRLTRVPAL